MYYYRTVKILRGNVLTQEERDSEKKFAEQLKRLSDNAKEQVMMYVEGFAAGYDACKARTTEKESA